MSTIPFTEKMKKKNGICSISDPLFPEADPQIQIRIHIQMKQICSGKNEYIILFLFFIEIVVRYEYEHPVILQACV